MNEHIIRVVFGTALLGAVFAAIFLLGWLLTEHFKVGAVIGVSLLLFLGYMIGTAIREN